MTEKIYKEKNGRYYEIGEEWEGFPANGLWRVKDGAHNLVTKEEHEDIPPFLPALIGKEKECLGYINSKISDRYSLTDVARYAAEYYSKLITEEDFPEAYL